MSHQRLSTKLHQESKATNLQFSNMLHQFSNMLHQSSNMLHQSSNMLHQLMKLQDMKLQEPFLLMKFHNQYTMLRSSHQLTKSQLTNQLQESQATQNTKDPQSKPQRCLKLKPQKCQLMNQMLTKETQEKITRIKFQLRN